MHTKNCMIDVLKNCNILVCCVCCCSVLDMKRQNRQQKHFFCLDCCLVHHFNGTLSNLRHIRIFSKHTHTQYTHQTQTMKVDVEGEKKSICFEKKNRMQKG